MKYVVYDPSNGRIIRFGEAPESQISTIIGSDESWLEADCGVGMRVDINSMQLVSMGDPPSLYHQFDYEIMEWSDVRTAQEIFVSAEAAVRERRSELLKQSDWTQLPDVPLATREAWATYRQILRDITEQEGYPHTVTWPVEPVQILKG